MLWKYEPNRLVNLNRTVQDERGIDYISIDVSQNENGDTFRLWIAQREHHLTTWWITYVGVAIIFGLEMYYISRNSFPMSTT
jgi:hypothetical protein